MSTSSNEWQVAIAAWHEGIRADNWTVVGPKGVPPPAAAMTQSWLVVAMEGDAETGDFSCLARDETGQQWFLSEFSGWCVVVPFPPRVLSSEEKVARARMGPTDHPRQI